MRQTGDYLSPPGSGRRPSRRRVLLGLLVGCLLLGQPTRTLAGAPQRVGEQTVLLAVAFSTGAPTTLVRQVIGQRPTAVWQGTYSGAPIAASSDGATIYLGTGHGEVARSDDGGRHWRVVGTPPAGLNPADAVVLALAVDPRNAEHVIAAAGTGLFESRDGGRSWNAYDIPAAVPYTHPFRAVAFDPRNSRSIWAGMDGGLTLIHSVDGGAHWRHVRGVAPSYGGTVWQVLVSAATSAVVWVGTEGGLYQSIDGGVSWIRLRRGLPARCGFTLLVRAVAPSHVYAVNECSGVYVTGDGGTNWTHTISWGTGASDPAGFALAADPAAPAVVYAAFNSVLLRSKDGGRTWRPWSATYRHGTYSALLAGGAGRLPR